jgi:saccharopine dehydrogenase (NADP+, L-glutamate forming)
MTERRILVLGSGMVAQPCIDYLLRDTNNILTVGQ